MSTTVKTRAEHMLSCALTYRESTPRESSVPLKFNTASEAVSQFMDVLLHEARESMQAPLASPPDQPFMHPVDVDTNEPGIVDQKEELHILRCATSMPRVVYRPRSTGHAASAPPPNASAAPSAVTINASAEKAEQKANKAVTAITKGAEFIAFFKGLMLFWGRACSIFF